MTSSAPGRKPLGASAWRQIAGTAEPAVHATWRSLLVCPDDDAPLEEDPTRRTLGCPACRRSYAEADGVLALLPSNDPYSLTEEAVAALEAEAAAAARPATPEEAFGALWARVQAVLGPLNGRMVLDAGCGDGFVAQWFAEQGAEVAALDQVAGVGGLGSVRERQRPGAKSIDLLRADLCRIPLRQESLDVVFLGRVLHRQARPERLVQEVGRILKPGGVAISIGEPIGSGTGTRLGGRDPRAEGRALSLRDYETLFLQGRLVIQSVFEAGPLEPPRGWIERLRRQWHDATATAPRFFVARPQPERKSPLDWFQRGGEPDAGPTDRHSG